MKHILILTSFQRPIDPQDPEYQLESTYALYEYLLKQNLTVTICRYIDLQYHLETSKQQITFNNVLLEEEFDCIVFRTNTLIFKYEKRFHPFSHLVASYADAHNMTTINGDHLRLFVGDFNKLFQMSYLSAHGLPIPETWTGNFLTNESPQLQEKLISKPIEGSHGNNIELFNASTTSQEDFSHMHIVQEFLPGGADYRVLVLNGQCLGVMKRTAQKDKIISNYSAGGAVEQVELTTEMDQLSVQVAKLFQLDFCGVDLMKNDQGKLVILEVNRFPEFKGFQKATNMNIPEKILQLIQQKVEPVRS